MESPVSSEDDFEFFEGEDEGEGEGEGEDEGEGEGEDEFPSPPIEKVSEFGLLPVRCVTCNKVLGNLQNPIEEDLALGSKFVEVFSKYKIDRYCCRRSIYTTINVIDEYANYEKLPQTVKIGEWKAGVRVFLAR